MKYWSITAGCRHPRATTADDMPRRASEVFVIDDQHPCDAASMMDVYAPMYGAEQQWREGLPW
jgi:hypothetical protein